MWLDNYFAVTIFGLNISSTRIFAESEFWLALVKSRYRDCLYCARPISNFGLIPFHGARLLHSLAILRLKAGSLMV